MNEPLPCVSVILPFYQAAPYLSRALDSIAASSYRRLDVVMVDDASTDDSPRIAQAYAAADPRFRYIRNDANRHVSFSRNRGLEAAQGEYVLFVDSDDRVSPGWIAGLLDDARRSGAEVVIGQSRRVTGGVEGPYPMRGLERRGELAFADVVLKDNSVVWNKLYDRSLLRRAAVRFEERLYMGEDLLFNYQALRAANRIFCSDHGFYCYHADATGSIMRGGHALARVENFTLLLDILLAESVRPGPVNRAVLRKVARDLLTSHAEAANNAPPRDPVLVRTVRGVDWLLPEKVRYRLWRKRWRRRILDALRSGFARQRG